MIEEFGAQRHWQELSMLSPEFPKFKNTRSIYFFGIWAGGLAGLLFPICFTGIFGEPMSQGIATFTASVSIPVLYLLGNILHTSCIPLGILLLMGYWVILGIGVSCSLVWLFAIIVRKYRSLVK